MPALRHTDPIFRTRTCGGRTAQLLVPQLPAGFMKDSDPVLLNEVVRAAHDAMLASDWDRLRLILHPYLHWTAADGSRLRGRTKVMDRLQNAAPPAEPVAVELRDGQIYRWQEPPNGRFQQQ